MEVGEDKHLFFIFLARCDHLVEGYDQFLTVNGLGDHQTTNDGCERALSQGSLFSFEKTLIDIGVQQWKVVILFSLRPYFYLCYSADDCKLSLILIEIESFVGLHLLLKVVGEPQ